MANKMAQYGRFDEGDMRAALRLARGQSAAAYDLAVTLRDMGSPGADAALVAARETLLVVDECVAAMAVLA